MTMTRETAEAPTGEVVPPSGATGLVNAPPAVTNAPATDDVGSAAFRAKLLAHFRTARDKAIADLARPAD